MPQDTAAGNVLDRYSWMEDYLEQLEGKEAREEYYAKLQGKVLPGPFVSEDAQRVATSS